MPLSLKVGARASRLSEAQVDEVWRELSAYHPVIFDFVRVTTQGDVDKATSLRHLEKTNFFTNTIDQMQLLGDIRISIHSAKDLPDPLHPDLAIVALTRGVDSSDSLVVCALPLISGARIGTSSLRREASLKAWRPDITSVDIRGTIDERLALLDNGTLDGVVMAEAALIRLHETHRPRLHLSFDTAPLQGKLAVLARKDDLEMHALFQPIDTR